MPTYSAGSHKSPDCGVALDAHRAATALIALMDGLWLELTLDAEAFSPGEAEAACLDYIDGLFPAAERTGG